MSGADAQGPLVIGFSGGGDSRALLQRALETCGARPVVAAIIDHGLREGSAAEAEWAAAIAREAGARAEIRTLTWPAKSNVSQAGARAGRMFALAQLAKSLGAPAIYLAHTMDDQAETVVMRAARGSGWRGLAGMAADAPAPLWPAGRHVRLRRPMLNTRRADLRAALAAAGAAWLDDPSNEADRFARVRIRTMLAQWESAGLGVIRWASLAARLAPLVARIDRSARTLIGEAATFSDGVVTLTPERYARAHPDVRAPALSALIDAAAGAGGGADWDQLVRLDAAILDGEAQAGTLGGARFFTKGGKIAFSRDPGAVLGRSGQPAARAEALPMGVPIVWDGRIALTAAEEGWDAVPGPEGVAPQVARAGAGGRLTLGEAQNQGVVRAEWLYQERIAHLLWR